MAEVPAKIMKIAAVTPGKLAIDAVPIDPDDYMVLACALEGQADCISSGGHHLIDLREFEGVRILDPGAYLQAFAKPEA